MYEDLLICGGTRQGSWSLLDTGGGNFLEEVASGRALKDTATRKVAGERDRGRDRGVTLDFRWLQLAGVKDTHAGVGTRGPEMRWEADGEAQGLNVSFIFMEAF